MGRGSVVQTIDALFAQSQKVSTREVAAQAGVSRQAAQKQLKAMVQNGHLSVEGKARAARYSRTHRVDALWAKVAQLGEALTAATAAPQLTFHAQARFPVDDRKRQRLEVASAGSLFRLSARLLLAEADADIVELDFNGVEDVGDEFLEEVFERWAEAQPKVTIQIVNVPPALEARVAAARG